MYNSNSTFTQNSSLKNNNDKIKNDVSQLITNLISELNNLDLEYKNKINLIEKEKETNKTNIINKYSTLYQDYFNNEPKNNKTFNSFFKKI